MPAAWLRYQQTLVLAAFVAGCTVAELQLRILASSMPAPPPSRPRIRLVSDLHGLLVEKDPP